MKEKAVSVILCLSLLLLIIFAPAVSSGAAKGLILWYSQVLPTLMPFTLILQFMLAGGTVSWLGHIMGPAITRIFGLSPAGSFCILTGFLCGFPMGALTASQIFEQKLINKEEAQLLAAACNNAGPMFLSSYILEQQLHTGNRRPVLTLIFYGSALLWLWIRSRLLHTKPISPQTSFSHKKNTSVSFRQILLNSSELMLKVGVSMMIFAIFCEIIQGISGISPENAAFVTLLMEITNGANVIAGLSLTNKIKTVLIMSGTAFGGLCIAFQTYTLIHSQKLSFIKYLIDKSAISILTGILTLLWLHISAG
ncbi:MAG: nucleoside recognition domain-containing protein [Coprococcus sp.]